MNKYFTRKNVKTVVQLAVALSVGYVVKEIVQNNTNPENPVEQTEVFVGSFALGMIVGDYTAAHTAKLVDTVADAFTKKTPVIIVTDV